MFAAQAYLYSNVSGLGLGMRTNPSAMDNSLQRLFQNAHSRAIFHQLKGALLRDTPTLHNLETRLSHHRIVSQSSVGIRSVAIENIQGSENRSGDFDRHFCPLQDHTRERWLSVARAALQGVPLPPVELVQVGNEYYVRDGHHRISVAKALGQKVLEAEVTVVSVE